MVKFAKQLEGQLVPEWRAAYVNYKILKKELSRLRSAAPRRVSDSPVFAMHALTRRRTTIHQTAKPTILVRNVDSSGSEEVYQTELLEGLATEDDAKLFFRRLDTEFNKVNRFYKCKEDEFMLRAQQLDKQITTLLQLKNLVQEQGTPSGTPPTRDEEDRKTKTDGELFPRNKSSLKPTEVNKDAVIPVEEFSDPRSPFTQQLELGNSSGERPDVDVEKSIEEIRENPLYESNDIFDDDTRNDSNVDAVDQEDVFISNEQELPSGQIVNENEKLSFSPRLRPVPVYDFSFQKANVPEFETEAEAEAEPVEPVKQSETFERRSTLASVVEEMESQVNESRLEAKKDHVKINIHMPITTPVATISAISQILWEDILQQMRRSSIDAKAKSGVYLSKKKVQYAEKVLHKALIEFYRGLGLLKSYSSLNMVAFVKILKKFDKVMEKEAAPIYLKAVENSYFSSSDRVTRLMEKVEKLFTKYFQANDRRKAMALLRPMQQKASHRVSFLIGLFTGGSVALVGVLAIIAPTTLWRYKAGGKSGEKAYYDSVFPLFSMMGLILIHMYMYGCDIYLWRRMHINYGFIFEFSPGNVLRYREMFLLCTSLTCVYLGIMVGHIAGHYSKKQPSPYFEFLPATVLTIFFLLLFCPFNFCYRSSRLFLLKTLLHIVCAPLYKVVLADFFLADQLTSQVHFPTSVLHKGCEVPSFRQLEYVLCYYIGSYYKLGNGDSCTKNVHFQRVVYVVSLAPYWWRFLQVLNLILRLAWLQSVARWELGNLDHHMTEFIFAGLEIMRRGMWNFFRIENEHLNNIGKFRAIKTVPLPFEELRVDDP
ncbi:hypothetical protein AXG93_3415s1140 [Marchantia polymorpha subsp. ruderalis]|uniref:SPX domain-containing protein n=1 Tax=Marchantia polymorpha subsp. ruderalis TaxID=1480154 RepID=A0A176WF67_MARPO|nr:hypothetical protein AXG93_3415s1140 [Marchantia polymorpha subsp. ruderalis]